MEFKGTKGNWVCKSIDVEAVKGATYHKITNGYKTIAKINATHKEEGYNNLKLILKAPDLLNAVTNLIGDLEDVQKLEACKKIIEFIKNDVTI